MKKYLEINLDWSPKCVFEAGASGRIHLMHILFAPLWEEVVGLRAKPRGY